MVYNWDSIFYYSNIFTHWL